MGITSQHYNIQANYKKTGLLPTDQLNTIGRLLNNITAENGIKVISNSQGIKIYGNGRLPFDRRASFDIQLLNYSAGGYDITIGSGGWLYQGSRYVSADTNLKLTAEEEIIYAKLDITSINPTVTIDHAETLPVNDSTVSYCPLYKLIQDENAPTPSNWYILTDIYNVQDIHGLTDNFMPFTIYKASDTEAGITSGYITINGVRLSVDALGATAIGGDVYGIISVTYDSNNIATAGTLSFGALPTEGLDQKYFILGKVSQGGLGCGTIRQYRHGHIDTVSLPTRVGKSRYMVLQLGTTGLLWDWTRLH